MFLCRLHVNLVCVIILRNSILVVCVSKRRFRGLLGCCLQERVFLVNFNVDASVQEAVVVQVSIGEFTIFVQWLLFDPLCRLCRPLCSFAFLGSLFSFCL